MTGMESRFILYCIILALYGICNAKYEPPTALWLYFGNDPNHHHIYNISNAIDILSDPNFNEFRPTVIYIHGWLQTPTGRSIQAVIQAYLQTENWNTILLDWQTLASPIYETATRNVDPLGKQLAEQLVHLFDSGLEIDTFHLVGHSLGAQVSAHAGRYVQSISNQKYILPRITGLDPAYPLWYDDGPNVPISKSDATFVDIIHTDAGVTGALRSTGTIDFWPNGGVRAQPGCPVDSDPLGRCHRRSCYFWAESLIPSNPIGSFLAVSASNWTNFQSGVSNILFPIHMGIEASIGFTGDWYLQTNAQTPFSRDFVGIRYKQPNT